MYLGKLDITIALLNPHFITVCILKVSRPRFKLPGSSDTSGPGLESLAPTVRKACISISLNSETASQKTRSLSLIISSQADGGAASSNTWMQATLQKESAPKTEVSSTLCDMPVKSVQMWGKERWVAHGYLLLPHTAVRKVYWCCKAESL